MNKEVLKKSLNNLLQGASMGIVVGLIPGAILGTLTAPFLGKGGIMALIAGAIVAYQFCVPFMVGYFTALQFKLNGIESAVLAGAAFLGSGALKFVDKGWTIKGTGDLINTMLTVAIALVLIKLYNNRWKSLNIVVLPLFGGVLPGLLGLLCLPAVSGFTALLGSLIKHLTTVQPLIMAVLISIIFSLIIVTPLSSVAIAYAVSISGLAAGAANLGIVATVFTLVCGSYMVNPKGITFSLFFAGPKLLMANYLQNLIMTVPLVINAAVVGVFAYLFNIQGTTQSAGFGITGLAGPLNAYTFMSGSSLINWLILLLVFVVVPLVVSIFTHSLLTKVGLYKAEIYQYQRADK